MGGAYNIKYTLMLRGTNGQWEVFVKFQSGSLKKWGHVGNIMDGNTISLLKAKPKLLYLKTQFVPRSKHFSSRLLKPISLCCKWHKSLFVKTHKYSVGRTYSCWMLNCWCITWPVGFKRLKCILEKLNGLNSYNKVTKSFPKISRVKSERRSNIRRHAVSLSCRNSTMLNTVGTMNQETFRINYPKKIQCRKSGNIWAVHRDKFA
jgi:hypothetical protein